MGFFKSIGNKLKRVVSIKNLTNVVTGKFSAVGADILRVTKTKSPAVIKAEQEAAAKANMPLSVSSVDTSLVPANATLPVQVQEVLAQADANYQTNLINSVAAIPAVQDVNTFLSKLYLQSMWTKHKNWIIGFIVAVILFFVGKKLFFSKGSKGGSRR
jgi:hypothetical protein